MRRSPLSRAVAAVLAIIASLAVPGSALAHGFAHHEAHEHALAGEGGAHGHAAATATRAVRAAHDDGDHLGHTHPQLGYAVAKRAESAPAPAAIVPGGTTLALDLTTVASTARTIVAAARPRADPAHGPPASPRAPPSRL